ncbi:hypothetical protein AYO39_02260 [Actinobacteria bacterium SCGC AG-212-D09]|nr:hypothetical protein AYO39_02260 [Actinobacteria bacterium SCGC AG-212-D09]
MFTDALPEYVDWTSFRYLNGPGRGFARWLAQLLPPNADVIPVTGWERDGNRWRSFGFVPLIAELAQPILPRQRTLLRQELAVRMPPVVPRRPRHQAPWKGKPMWELNTAFAYDIYGVDTVTIAQALDLSDYLLYNPGVVLDDESRGGYRYLKEGRARLAGLGAWPWCVADDAMNEHESERMKGMLEPLGYGKAAAHLSGAESDVDVREAGGKLPDGWWAQQDYAEALGQWHYQQRLAALAADASSMMPVTRRPPLPPLKKRAEEWARARYREDYLSGLAARD